MTFKVDHLVLQYAAGRALREGTSLNALVNNWLENYSGVHPPAWARPRRRRARVQRPSDELDVAEIRRRLWFRERMSNGGGRRA